MVVFTCQYCNASLKKKAVESHRFQCRRDYHLTCIDCLQDFFGNEYVKHISCISEEQKYGGKNYVPSSVAGKQVVWLSAINAALKSDVPNQIREVLDAASSNPNIPRHKKKFMNFFLNQASFKCNKFLSQAYDAAETEMKKLEVKTNKPNNSPQKADSAKQQSEETQKKKEKKRKTISETQEDLECGLEKANHVETKNKKKKKLREGNHCESVTEVPENHESKKSKKKKKKSVSLDEDQVEEEVEQTEKQKKPKENGVNGVSGYVIDLSGEDDAIPEANEDNVEESSTALPDEWSQLSKKERKKLIKQMKYEAEINSIENYNKENEETPEPVGKKKKKKDKTLNGDVEPKRETKSSVSEPDGKKPKLEEEEEVEELPPAKPKKFRWDRMILEVLKSAPDHEMSLKRLSRKVCGEYQLLFGDKETYDDILLTFNKKVMKTHGVRVFKDKAKIVS